MNRQSDKAIYSQIYRQKINRYNYRHIDRQTGKQINRQLGKAIYIIQSDIQTENKQI